MTLGDIRKLSYGIFYVAAIVYTFLAVLNYTHTVYGFFEKAASQSDDMYTYYAYDFAKKAVICGLIAYILSIIPI